MNALERENLLKIFNNDQPDEKLLFSKVLNQVSLCEKKHETSFTDFLDPYRANIYVSAIKTIKNLGLNIAVFGGMQGSERLVIGFSPDYIELANDDFPIDVIKITYDTRFSSGPSHRDLLGSILGLGIQRSKIGDIIIEGSVSYVFVYNDISEYIITNLEKAGRTKMRADKYTGPIQIQDFNEKESVMTVSSLRIDTMISHIFKLSRSKAAEYIIAEKVFINWQPVLSLSKNVAVGDVITLRGQGRARIVDIPGRSKKDKIIVKFVSAVR